MPTYNRADLFEETLCSVVSQERPPDEIIVVDDSEEDYVTPLSEEYLSDGQIELTHIRGKEHATLGDVLNTGLDHVSGEYIFMIDDDDIAKPSLIRKELEKIQEKKLDFCTAEHEMIDMSGDVQQTHSIELKENALKTLLFENELLTPSGVLYKTEIIDEVGGFDPEMSLGSDWDFFIRIASEYEIGYVDQKLIKYRVHNNQMTSENKSKEVRQLLSTVHQKYEEDAREVGFGFYREFNSHTHMWIAGQYDNLSNRLTKGVYRIILAFVWYPERLVNLPSLIKRGLKYFSGKETGAKSS